MFSLPVLDTFFQGKETSSLHVVQAEFPAWILCTVIGSPQALAVQKLRAVGQHVISTDCPVLWTSLAFCLSFQDKSELHSKNCSQSAEGKYDNECGKWAALEAD